MLEQGHGKVVHGGFDSDDACLPLDTRPKRGAVTLGTNGSDEAEDRSSRVATPAGRRFEGPMNRPLLIIAHSSFPQSLSGNLFSTRPLDAR